MIETIISVDGMACKMCESHLNSTIRSAFCVKKVCSSHKKGRTVILSDQPLDEEKLLRAIRATGYHAGSIDTHPYEKRRLFSRC